MAAVSSKRVLIICPDMDLSQTTLGYHVAQELERTNVPVLTPSQTEINWLDVKDVKNYFAVHQPRIAVCAFPVGHNLRRQVADAQLKESYFVILQNIAEACAKSGCVPLLFSDYHVFGQETKNAYTPTDPVAPLDDFGRYVASLETVVTSSVEQHVILRFGWLVDATTENLFTRILACLHGEQKYGVKKHSGGDLSLSRHRRGSPIWENDAIRVVSGLVRQVMSGAENWGNFHYCSSDSCNEMEFAEAVKAAYAEFAVPVGTIVEEDSASIHSQGVEPASASLTCVRIKNNFGIRGRSWRQGLKANVQEWLLAHGVSIVEEPIEASGA